MKNSNEPFYCRAVWLTPLLGAVLIGAFLFLFRERPLLLSGTVALSGFAVVLLVSFHERNALRLLNRAREKLRRSEESCALVSALSGETLFRYDCRSRELRLYQGGSKTMEKTSRTPEDANLSGGETPALLPALERAMAEASCKGALEFSFDDPAGQVLWRRADYRMTRDADGAPLEMVGKLTDITEQKRALDRLLRQAESDPLTSLLNRSAMRTRAETFLQGDGRDGLHAFFMIDVDNFKQVNDVLGHPVGDRLLVAFAAQVVRLFRAGDLVCRMGGDEFSVLLKDVRDLSHAAAKAREICACMDAVNGALSVAITASVGISVYRRDGDTFDRLYEKADRALYRAKRLGKNQVAFFCEAEADA